MNMEIVNDLYYNVSTYIIRSKKFFWDLPQHTLQGCISAVIDIDTKYYNTEDIEFNNLNVKYVDIYFTSFIIHDIEEQFLLKQLFLSLHVVELWIDTKHLTRLDTEDEDFGLQFIASMFEYAVKLLCIRCHASILNVSHLTDI